MYNYAGSKILLVEDEETLAIGLEYNLVQEQYKVVRAEDGKKAIEYFNREEFDLIILDIMIPYFDGFEVARRIREKSPQMPILMLTARTSAKDRIEGLEIGADDYLTKPFHLDELLLRVKGMLKRKRWYQEITANQPEYSFGDNVINFENLSCRSGRKEFRLTPQEALIMRYLINRKGKIVSRQELLENVWNVKPGEFETRTIDNFIVRLRKYFEPYPVKPVYIKSVRGAGYIFIDK
ncbi:response regulator transcription factor [candidate division KSB1 bacterium]|nr:response regulator transcription factor [candidate division KSB1 bacterium]